MTSERELFVRGGWRDKSRHGVVLLRAIGRRTPVVLRTIAPRDENPAEEKHCIVLHGWASHGDESNEIWQAARALPASASWRCWDATYDSHWTSFGDSARAIVHELNALPFDFSNSILIGNSMGGIVARQMVALGFPCRALLTVCSPHAGPAPWIPVPSRGPRSIARWSRSLRALNDNALDRAARDRYHFFAITYRDALGQHQHDGIVQRESALGLELGPVAQRHEIHLRYRTVAAFDAHWRSRFACNLAPVVRTLNGLMANL